MNWGGWRMKRLQIVWTGPKRGQGVGRCLERFGDQRLLGAVVGDA